MFEDYKKAVLDFYLAQKEAGLLSTNMENPNRSKLKRECLKIFSERHSKEDDIMIRSFFDPTNKFNDYIRSIERFDLNKFRPLVGFLTSDQNIRDEEAVKLLAWLVGFKSYGIWRSGQGEINLIKDPESQDHARPIEDVLSNSPLITPTYLTENHPEHKQEIEKVEKLEEDAGKKDSGESNGSGGFMTFQSGNGGQDSPEGTPKIPIDESDSKPPISTLKIIMICIMVLVVGTGTFQFWGNKKGRVYNSLFLNQDCMYWTGDRYQPIVCDQKKGDTPIIALDTQKVAHLKRITQPDTLTLNSLGKVWYVKIGGKPEFYTSDGFHPVYNDRRLKPTTEYILKEYILNK
ncbi:hypothetical protein [Pedobacter punctiformis]|uniref:Uncharacterized protein n=1 Tax=Pedobacter punctiformis TaxID=3004097 RepID=A0ABT4LC27_9SPHI|nr:hypothetical protein [Pedobacter sp. HCMS5-2]MCZ4245267.1 hypothetical protein [Pedobacter sp. HCMS5-2]